MAHGVGGTLNSEVGIVAGFSVLVLLLVFKKPVWLALLAASAVMGLASTGLHGFVNLVVSTAFSTVALDLIVVVFLIALLVNLYNATGFIRKLGEELVKLAGKPRLVASLVPAVMGLLPVPGGALMSAPVVETVGNYIGLSSERKVFVNVWFRHVVFIVYPLSATIITAASLAGVNLWSLVVRGLPIALAMAVAGYVLGFRETRVFRVERVGSTNWWELTKTLTPILTAITVAIATSPVIDSRLVLWIPLTRYSMVLGLVLAIVLLVKLSRTGLGVLARAVTSRTTVELVLASFGAVLLRDAFTTAGGPGLVSRAIPLTSGVGRVALMIALPFTASLATGSPLMGIAISLPVFKTSFNLDVREVALIYASNMLGYIASPVHLCYVYTAQYFKVPLTSTYREVFTATTTAILVAITLYTLT